MKIKFKKWGSPYSCFEVEKPVNMLFPGVRRIEITRPDGKEQDRGRKVVEWTDPPLPCCFVSLFCNFPQQEACSLCTDVPPSLREKIGRRDYFLPIFFLREGGTSALRLEACSGWFLSSG